MLLDRGTNPRARDEFDPTHLISHADEGMAACVARLMEDAGGRATVNMQVDRKIKPGNQVFMYTALHFVCAS